MVPFLNKNFQFQYSQASTFGNVISIFIPGFLAAVNFLITVAAQNKLRLCQAELW